jgi:hypothetical protein
MDERALAAYVDDHLAAAAAGAAIARRLRAETARPSRLWRFLDDLTTHIDEERGTLREVLAILPGSPGLVKQLFSLAGAAANLVRTRIPGAPAPTMLEDLEALTVGVWGKRLLWGVLAAAAEQDDRFARFGFEELAERAESQERSLIGFRQDAVAATLALPDARDQ